jgi:hypothetical protein
MTGGLGSLVVIGGCALQAERDAQGDLEDVSLDKKTVPIPGSTDVCLQKLRIDFPAGEVGPIVASYRTKALIVSKIAVYQEGECLLGRYDWQTCRLSAIGPVFGP